MDTKGRMLFTIESRFFCPSGDEFRIGWKVGLDWMPNLSKDRRCQVCASLHDSMMNPSSTRMIGERKAGTIKMHLRSHTRREKALHS